MHSVVESVCPVKSSVHCVTWQTDMVCVCGGVVVGKGQAHNKLYKGCILAGGVCT